MQCPKCGCDHIGTDVIYTHGLALFCQACGYRGERVPIDQSLDNWFQLAQEQARDKWNEQTEGPT